MRDHATTNSRAWWIVAGLLITAFLARAPLYLSVFPPFEGWDEYQHLGYIAYLDQTGTIPVFSTATRVPLSIRPLVIAMPHSQWGGDQVREWGALSYPDYWNAQTQPGAAPRGAFSSPRLYQAQHPPLAYALAVPVWHALKRTHPVEAIYAIRAMNLLFVAIGLAVFAGALARLMPRRAPRVAVFALVCLHPLFFQNVARVANDGLAVATGVAGISLVMLADRPTLLTRGLLAAACIAASVWSKQTGLTLIPVLLFGLPLVGWVHGVSAGRLFRSTAVVAVVLLLLVSPLWLWSYRHYGAIVTTQESLQLAADGPVLGKLVASFEHLRWPPLIDTLFVPGRPWVGGWSFLPMQRSLADLYGWYWRVLLMAAALGGVIAMLRRWRSIEHAAPVPRIDGQALAGLAVCAAAVIFTAVGLIHHAVVSNAVFGQSMTNPWYFMTALPFLFVLLVRGLEAIDSRLATIAAGGLALLLVAIDLHGTWIDMPGAYASTGDAALQWSRLTSIHPAILSGDLRWLFLAMQLGALALVIGGLVYTRNWRFSPTTTGIG